MNVEFERGAVPGDRKPEIEHVLSRLETRTGDGPARQWAGVRDELRVLRNLQGGRSPSEVLEVERISGSQRLLKVVKIGSARELHLELTAYRSLLTDRNAYFAPIEAGTPGVYERTPEEDKERQAIVYAHVEDWFSVERIGTLEELATRAIEAGGTALDECVAVIEKLFDGVHKCLYGKGRRIEERTRLAEFWNESLGPDVVVTADRWDPATRLLSLGSPTDTLAVPRLFPGHVAPWPADRHEELMGKQVYMHPLIVDDRWDGLVLRFQTSPRPFPAIEVEWKGPGELPSLTNGEVSEPLSLFGRVEGFRSQLRRSRVLELLDDVTLENEVLDAPGCQIRDPFRDLPKVLTSGAPNRRVSVVHGDMNSRNVIVADRMPCLIDFALTSADQPPLKDFVRLEVTLAREALPAELAWEDHVQLQRLLAASCRLGRSSIEPLGAHLAKRRPELGSAFRIFATIRAIARELASGPRRSWCRDYHEQLYLMAHLSLKWGQWEEALRASLAIAGVAAEALTDGECFRHWALTDLRRDLRLLMELEAERACSPLRTGSSDSPFELYNAARELERRRMAPSDPLFRAFERARDSYVRGSFPDRASQILGDRWEAHNVYMKLKAHIDLQGTVTRQAMSEEAPPYYAYLRNEAMGGEAGPLGPTSGQVTNAIEWLRAVPDVVLIGDAGSGKTTVAHEWEFLLAKAIKGGDGRASLPLVVTARQLLGELRQARDGVEDPPPDDEDTMAAVLGREKALLATGAVHVIVDALNELAVADRGEVASWLTTYKQVFPLSPLLVCHRQYNWEPGLLPFDVLTLQKVDEEAIKAYIYDHLKNEGYPDHPALAGALIDLLFGDPDRAPLRDFVRTPLFLWMMVEFYGKEGVLPESLGGLFGQFVDRRLESGAADGADADPSGMSGVEKSELLGVIGYELVKRRETEMPRSEVPGLLGGEEEWTSSHDAALGEVAQTQLLEVDGHRIRFPHQSFQEFFAARYFLAHDAQDVRLLRARLAQYGWHDTFIILLGFGGIDPDTVLRVLEEAFRLDALLAARCLRVTESVDATLARGFVESQKRVLLDPRTGAYGYERAANALSEFGLPEARKALLEVARDAAAPTAARLACLQKFAAFLGQARFERHEEEIRADLGRLLGAWLNEGAPEALLTAGIDLVRRGDLGRAGGAYLFALLETGAGRVRWAAWRACEELGLLITEAHGVEFTEVARTRLAQLDRELEATHVTAEVNRLNDERVGILKQLRAPADLDVILGYRFALRIDSRMAAIVDAVEAGDPPEELRDAWNLLRATGDPLETSISEWVSALESGDRLLALAAAHRLVKEAKHVPLDALRRLIAAAAEAEPFRLLAIAAVLEAADDSKVADDLDGLLRELLPRSRRTPEVAAFTRLALALKSLDPPLGNRLMALAASYFFNVAHATHAQYPLRILHNSIHLTQDDYRALLAAGGQEAEAVIYRLLAESPELIAAERSMTGTALRSPARELCIAEIEKLTHAKWQGFAAKAACSLNAIELLPWFVEISDGEELRRRAVTFYLPDLGTVNDRHLATVHRAMGYLSQVAVAQGQQALAKPAIDKLHQEYAALTETSDRSIVCGLVTARGYLGEWRPILEHLAPCEPWLKEAALNVFRLWIPRSPDGYDRRVEAGTWIARQLAAPEEMLPAVRSALEEIKKQIEDSIGHILTVDAEGELLVEPPDRGSFGRELRRETEQETERRLRERLRSYPNDAGAAGQYALFLKNSKKDWDRAEEYYRRALAGGDDDATIVGNFAFFLDSIRDSVEEARKLYKRAIELNEKDGVILGNYAVFLWNRLGESEEAAEFFAAAFEVLGEEDGNLNANFAAYLISEGRTEEAEEWLRDNARRRRVLDRRALAKTLFLLCVLGFMRRDSTTQALGRLKAVVAGDFMTHPWPIGRLVELLRSGSSGEDFALIEAMARVVSDERELPPLEELSAWTDVEEIDVAEAWEEIDE